MAKVTNIEHYSRKSKHIERSGKKMATVIIGEDAYSDDEYVIYNGDYSFQSKVVFSNDDRKLPDDAYETSVGYILYDFIWQDGNRPKQNILKKVLKYVEDALENDINKSSI